MYFQLVNALLHLTNYTSCYIVVERATDEFPHRAHCIYRPQASKAKQNTKFHQKMLQGLIDKSRVVFNVLPSCFLCVTTLSDKTKDWFARITIT
jgi:hypothetical protein